MKIPTGVGFCFGGLSSCLGLIAMFSVATSGVMAATYYVSPSGNDSSAGTSTTTPWRTIAKVNSVAFAAGDVILFRGGATYAGTLSFDAGDTGTDANRIMVSSYGNGKATINGGAGKGVSLYNTAGFTIANLIIKGSGIGVNIGTGIDVYTDLPGKRTGIWIQNCDVSGFSGQATGTQVSQGHGISISGWRADSQAAGFDKVEILDTVVSNCQVSGLSTWAHVLYGISNVTVRGCTFHSIPGRGGMTHPTGSGVVLGRVDTGLIERCVAYNNGADNTHTSGPVGIWTYDSKRITIQYCESYANKSAGADGGGFDLDGGVTDSVIQYCYSHDNHGAGYLLACYADAPPLANNVIRYNISQNDGRRGGYGGIMLWGAGANDKVETTLIYNNTVYMGAETPVVSGSPSAVRFSTGNSTGIRFWNNLFVTNAGLRIINSDTAFATSAVQFQNNNYWAMGAFSLKWGGTTHAGFGAWTGAATTQERLGSILVGLNLNPQLAAPGAGGTIGHAALLASNLPAYKLQATSLLIDEGLNLQSLFGVNPGAADYYRAGIPWGGDHDIGAHEHGGAGGSLSAPMRFEVEAVAAVTTSSGDTITDILEPGLSAGQAKQLNANATGDYVSYVVPAVPAGTYTVKYGFKRAPDRGVCQLYIDGVAQGAPQNQTGGSGYAEFTLPAKTFAAAGARNFRFQVSGSTSGSYNLSVDYIALE